MTSTTEMARLMDTIAELTRERGDALRELERERASRPTPGLWLVEGRTTGWSGRWIAAGDVPDPLPVAALERHRDAMQRAVAASLDAGWRSDGQGGQYRVLPSVAAIVSAIIAAVAAEMEHGS